MTTTGKKLNECGHELNTDVELVAGDVNGTSFKRSLNLKLLFAWSVKGLSDARSSWSDRVAPKIIQLGVCLISNM